MHTLASTPAASSHTLAWLTRAWPAAAQSSRSITICTVYLPWRNRSSLHGMVPHTGMAIYSPVPWCPGFLNSWSRVHAGSKQPVIHLMHHTMHSPVIILTPLSAPLLQGCYHGNEQLGEQCNNTFGRNLDILAAMAALATAFTTTSATAAVLSHSTSLFCSLVSSLAASLSPTVVMRGQLWSQRGVKKIEALELSKWQSSCLHPGQQTKPQTHAPPKAVTPTVVAQLQTF